MYSVSIDIILIVGLDGLESLLSAPARPSPPMRQDPSPKPTFQNTNSPAVAPSPLGGWVHYWNIDTHVSHTIWKTLFVVYSQTLWLELFTHRLNWNESSARKLWHCCISQTFKFPKTYYQNKISQTYYPNIPNIQSISILIYIHSQPFFFFLFFIFGTIRKTFGYWNEMDCQ